MPDLILSTQAIAGVNVLHLLAKVADHLRESGAYTDSQVRHGIDCLEGLIVILKSQTGNQQINGRGFMGRG